MDCLTLLLNYISSAFEKKEVVVAVFLDVKGAFDNVNIDILCDKLHQLGAPRRIINMAWALMNERPLNFENETGDKVQESVMSVCHREHLTVHSCTQSLHMIYTRPLDLMWA